MFRGAFILAMGYIAGYAHAAAHNDEISKAVQDLKRTWAEAENTDTQTDDDVVEGEIAHGE